MGPDRRYHSRPEWTLERLQWWGTLHSPKLQHYWSLTMRLFRITSRKLVVGSCPLCREVVSVFYSPSWIGWEVFGKYKLLNLWKIPVVVGSTAIDGVLTFYSLVHFLWDFNGTQFGNLWFFISNWAVTPWKQLKILVVV